MKTKNIFLKIVFCLIGLNQTAFAENVMYCRQVTGSFNNGTIAIFQVDKAVDGYSYFASICARFHGSGCSDIYYENGGAIERESDKNNFKNENISIKSIYQDRILLFTDRKENITLMFNESECSPLQH